MKESWPLLLMEEGRRFRPVTTLLGRMSIEVGCWSRCARGLVRWESLASEFAAVSSDVEVDADRAAEFGLVMEVGAEASPF